MMAIVDIVLFLILFLLRFIILSTWFCRIAEQPAVRRV